MKKISQIVFTILVFSSTSVFSQNKDYNEDEVRKLLDKYIENPKLYYEKIKTLNERAEKANENTMKVSEEYLSLLDKKDSLIKIYKSKATMASRVAPAPAATGANGTNATPITTGSIAKPSQQTATIVTKVAGKTEHTPYRVQLAAYFRDDFEKFFGNFNKTLGIQKLNNRNVIEVQGFRDEAEALEFSQKIQKLGFPGAFVTKYDANGEREEGVAKTDTKMFSSDPAPTKTASPPVAAKPVKTAQYPDYIPIGYKEHMQKKSEPVAVKPPVAPAPAAPAIAPKAKASEPVQLRAPVVQRDAIISSTPPAPPQVNKPKNIASSAPVPSASESAAKPAVTPSPAPKPTNTPPPVNKNTKEQLDAAFDQLFKR
jgi:hypothetical protein